MFEELTFSKGITAAGPNILIPVTMPAVLNASDVLTCFVFGGVQGIPAGWTKEGTVSQVGVPSRRVVALYRIAGALVAGSTENFPYFDPGIVAAQDYIAVVHRQSGIAPTADAYILGGVHIGASPGTVSWAGANIGAVHRQRVVAICLPINIEITHGWQNATDRGGDTFSGSGNLSLAVGDVLDETGATPQIDGVYTYGAGSKPMLGNGVEITIPAPVNGPGFGFGGRFSP